MAWGKCPTHGPIQDARVEERGSDSPARLWCVCNLECEPFQADEFVEHDELKELAKTSKQPKATKKKTEESAPEASGEEE